ncbi:MULTISPECIES: hypothetical protein [unclassified Streptomyces]|uniref:hypothetical protein n=1 Tax=unclassified Streptomyces TaxID=2593676 RepID=UPI003393C636
MPVPPTSGRLQWTDVPPPLRARLEDTLDAPVTGTATPAGGFGHQLAATLTVADGRRVFDFPQDLRDAQLATIQERLSASRTTAGELRQEALVLIAGGYSAHAAADAAYEPRS